MRQAHRWLLFLLGGAAAAMVSSCQSAARFSTIATRAGEAGTMPKALAELPSPLREAVVRWLGTPYCRGGTGAECVDCSGFVQQVFRAIGISLPRTSAEQARAGSPVHDRPAPGDIIVVVCRGNVQHVGIYLGNGYVVHASQSRGVVIDPLPALVPAEGTVQFRRLLPPGG